jgi:hypothetical protein
MLVLAVLAVVVVVVEVLAQEPMVRLHKVSLAQLERLAQMMVVVEVVVQVVQVSQELVVLLRLQLVALVVLGLHLLSLELAHTIRAAVVEVLTLLQEVELEGRAVEVMAITEPLVVPLPLVRQIRVVVVVLVQRMLAVVQES